MAKMSKPIYPTAPKGLKGRFVEIGETILPNDLIDYSSFPKVENCSFRGGWKKVGTSGHKTKQLWYFRPSEAYQLDQTSYYLGPQAIRDDYIDIEEVPVTPEKPKEIYLNIKKDDFYNSIT